MAERDLGSTLLMPQTHLYKHDRVCIQFITLFIFQYNDAKTLVTLHYRRGNTENKIKYHSPMCSTSALYSGIPTSKSDVLCGFP
jgi:hypothetical protein